jgi:hypothetical protein
VTVSPVTSAQPRPAALRASTEIYRSINHGPFSQMTHIAAAPTVDASRSYIPLDLDCSVN